MTVAIKTNGTWYAGTVAYVWQDPADVWDNRSLDSAGQVEMAIQGGYGTPLVALHMQAQWVHVVDPAGVRGRWLKFTDWQNVVIPASAIQGVTDTDEPV